MVGVFAMRRAMGRGPLLCAGLAGALAAGPAAHAGSISILQQFQGGSEQYEATNFGGYSYPPDMAGAVGNGYVMQLVNGEVSTYTTSGAAVGAPLSLDQFWNSAGYTTGGTFDPRLTYDPVSNRWFAISDANGSGVVLAVSRTGNPTAGFTALTIPGAAGQFTDFPTLGVSGNSVTIGVNDFNVSGAYSGASLYTLPKGSLTGATPSLAGLTSFSLSNQLELAPQGVSDPAGSGTTTKVLSLAVNGVAISTVSGTGSGASLLYDTTLTGISVNNPIPPATPSGYLTFNIDSRISSTVTQVGNDIYFANNVLVGTQDEIQWGIVNATTDALLKSGFIGMAGIDLSYGSIAANANGTFVIGFNGSGSKSNISDYAAVCSEITGTCASPRLIYGGTAADYAEGRWGDYSVTSVDPTNPNDFWLFQEFPYDAAGSPWWGTMVTEIGTAPASPVPEPGSLLLLAAGGVGLGALRRQRRGAPA